MHVAKGVTVLYGVCVCVYALVFLLKGTPDRPIHTALACLGSGSDSAQ